MDFLNIGKWILGCLLFVSTAHGASLTAEQMESLAKRSAWLDLLHYHQVGVISPYESQVDDEQFFLATDGKHDPLAELEATLLAFQQPYTGEDINQAAQCLYPARFHWLKEQGLAGLVDVNCPEFSTWFKQIDGESVYLIFPAAYLNSPSSMYGHTLLRIKKKGNDAPLLDYAVNYAANADPDDNQLVFSYKGLTGGYPGVISVTPYYEKVKEYNFLESRDIWEYKLNLSQAEVDQFLRHIWEVRNIYMEYYFFSENCSYQLLAMLDASSERLNTTDNFNFWAIPADTVRVLKEQGIVDEVSYRASVVNRMNHMLSELSDEQLNVAKALVDNEALDLSGLEPFTRLQQAQILEVAYQYSRYLSARQKSKLSYLNSRSIKLLSLRSKYEFKNVFQPLVPPAVRDDEGHKTQRLGLTLGQSDNSWFSQLEYRPSYHDLLDAKGGYLEGAELSMFSGSISVSEDDSLRLEELSLINIRSLAPANALVTPKSWQVNAALVRDFTIEDKLAFRIKGGAGITEQWGEHMFSALFNGRGSLNKAYERDYRVQLGPQLQWLYAGDVHRVMASYEYLIDVDQHKGDLQVAQLEWAYLLNKDWQIRSGIARQKQDELSQNITKLTLLHYF